MKNKGSLMPKHNPYTLRDPVNLAMLGKFITTVGGDADHAIANLCEHHGIDRIALANGKVAVAVKGGSPVSLAATSTAQTTCPASLSPGQKAEYGSITPTEAFVGPILKTLANAPGHQMKAKDVIKAVMAQMEDKLLPIDLEMLPGGSEIRAHNKINWARAFMMPHKVDTAKPNLKPKSCAGYLDPNAGRGIWKLSKKGLNAAKSVNV